MTLKFAILGGGNAGATIAAHLKLLGHHVRLYDVFPEAIQAIVDAGNQVVLSGNLPIQGTVTLDGVSTDLATSIADAEILICTTPAHVHRYLARDLAPLLESEQALVLYPGRTGGVLEFRKELIANNGVGDAYIAETQTIAYACRKSGNAVNVFGYKQEIPFAGLPSARQDDFATRIKQVFPNWKVAPSIWHTSLHNIGMLFHPAPTLLNLGRMESGIPFDYYIEGFTPSIAQLVSQLDEERLDVARALGIELPNVCEWLQTNYGCQGSSLYETLQNNQSYIGIKAPALKSLNDKLQLRYVIEDVPTGLVPVAALGNLLGVKTPNLNAIIDLANVLYQRDFRSLGRNLDQLGLSSCSAESLRNLELR